MRILVNDIHHSLVFYFLQIVDGCLEVFLVDMVHNHHLEVVFHLGKVDEVVCSTMRLHYAVDKGLVQDFKVLLQQMV